MIYDLQKASLMKRFSAFLLDFILMVILITGLMLLLVWVTGYDNYTTEFKDLLADYEEQFDLNFDITTDEYNAMTDAEKEYFDSCYNTVVKSDEYMYLTNMIFRLTVLMISLSLFGAFFIVEFIIPLLFKNGQTLGKKVFGIAVMRLDGVRVTPVIMFVRSILGKYTVETMVLVIILIMHAFGLGTIVTLAVLVLLPLFNIILLIATKTNSFIHDILAATVTVDLQSQMIFDTLEEKEAYKLRIHREEAQKAKYF